MYPPLDAKIAKEISVEILEILQRFSVSAKIPIPILTFCVAESLLNTHINFLKTSGQKEFAKFCVAYTKDGLDEVLKE